MTRPINEKTMLKNGKCRFFKKGKDGYKISSSLIQKGGAVK